MKRLLLLTCTIVHFFALSQVNVRNTFKPTDSRFSHHINRAKLINRPQSGFITFDSMYVYRFDSLSQDVGIFGNLIFTFDQENYTDEMIFYLKDSTGKYRIAERGVLKLDDKSRVINDSSFFYNEYTGELQNGYFNVNTYEGSKLKKESSTSISMSSVNDTSFFRIDEKEYDVDGENSKYLYMKTRYDSVETVFIEYTKKVSVSYNGGYLVANLSKKAKNLEYDTLSYDLVYKDRFLNDSLILYNYNQETGIGVSKREFVYNNKNKLINDESYRWYNGKYTLVSKDVFVYDSLDRLIQHLTSNWDQGEFSMIVKNINKYDSQNNLYYMSDRWYDGTLSEKEMKFDNNYFVKDLVSSVFFASPEISLNNLTLELNEFLTKNGQREFFQKWEYHYSGAPVSVVKEHAKEVISVFPNPVDDYFSLSFKEDYMLNVQVINHQGVTMFTRTNVKSNEKIYTNSLEKGMYIARASNASGHVFTSKFVVD